MPFGNSAVICFGRNGGEERPAMKSRAQLTKKESVMQSQSNGRKKNSAGNRRGLEPKEYESDLLNCDI